MSARATAWLSRGFEQLLYDVHHGKRKAFDIVIVGSGYGGAIAAAELAGCTDKQTGKPISVCVLERGKEYLPGMFPSRMSELPGHIRFSTAESTKARGEREGLFDVRIGPDVCALVANGLGGGSLINAGVMEEPSEAVYADWPETLRKELPGYLQEATRRLGAMAFVNACLPTKFRALQGLDGAARAASITVAPQDGPNQSGVALRSCKFCGDCATGCNHDAKNSLDVNLLVEAHRKGAEIYTGATVLRIDPKDSAWELEVVHTDEKLRRRQVKPLRLPTRRVILAAGTFGSTEILLRSRSDALPFSSCLGDRFSANGDTIAVAYAQRTDVNAIATESIAPADRDVGPTITGMIDRRIDEGLVIEELAIPGPLRRAFEEMVTTSNTLYDLAECDRTTHDPDSKEHDPCAVDRRAIQRSSVLAVMGDDGAQGHLELIKGHRGDSGLRVRWRELRNLPLFGLQVKALQERVRETGGRLLPNPLWQLLPASMQFLFGNERGPAFTVHPLGGCPIGESAARGVVDDLGRVFDISRNADATATWEGLAVLDGSIVPSALGINPGLTIAALALRAVSGLRKQWGLEASKPGATRPPECRPIFSDPANRLVANPRATRIEVVERLSGKMTLDGRDGARVPCVVELTLEYEELSLSSLVLRERNEAVPMPRVLPVREGRLRVFDEAEWTKQTRAGASEKELDQIALLAAPLTGRLTFLQREASTPSARRCRALPAWLLNRGLRDTWQWAADGGSAGMRSLLSLFPSALRRAWNALALASHAGEVRLFEYDLTVGRALTIRADSLLPPPDEIRKTLAIRGVKRLTYARRANPWRQLMEMELAQFLWTRHQYRRPTLEIDTNYFGRRAIPLLHVVDQEDQPAALADLASFFAYFLRLLLTIHVWSFRKPDTPPVREPLQLPGSLEGLPAEIRYVKTGERLPDGTAYPVRIRLARYRPAELRTKRPVLMIHGYSASGTTFAHPALPRSLVRHFCDHGRDAWVLDLRTSCGMPTARYPWTFEDAALADIPKAVDEILSATEQPTLDVVAHCMGAAMFSMTVLAPQQAKEPYPAQRKAIRERIERVVLSQVGPRVVLSPANIFRGYLMTYLRQVLPLGDYEFRVRPDQGIAGELLDRFLATLPYPDAEFDRENPAWPPWARRGFVASRHRMDALYGRVFALGNLDDRVLGSIDDLFGPMNIDTVAQVIHFARTDTVTNPEGVNIYAGRENLAERWTFPTLSIHGAQNALSDVATLTRNTDLFEEAGRKIIAMPFDGRGHQDCLIGVKVQDVFNEISGFLQ